MEAMSFGVPCIASDIPCIPDLIENKKSGFLCDKDDVKSFSRALAVLLRNDEKRKSMGREALIQISEFDWDRIILSYEKIYSELLDVDG
jgi:glycosyltransferase involved in cell wall biosynthesis